MEFPIRDDTFLISDTHFGHKAVLEREPSRLKSAYAAGYDDFYAYARDLWNMQVTKKSYVIHLGDLFYGGGMPYLKNLNGNKLLIIGNNDIKRLDKLTKLKSWRIQYGLKLEIPEKRQILSKLYAEFGKEIVKNDMYLHALVLDYGKERILFSHFPVFHAKSREKFTQSCEILDRLFTLADCSLNMHGHLHSRNTNNSFCFNVSCEQLGFAPRKLSEILTLWRHKSAI